MQGRADSVWQNWQELSWFSHSEPAGALIALVERLLEGSLDCAEIAPFFAKHLPEIATEFSVQWAALIRCDPDWSVVESCGRSPFNPLPISFLNRLRDHSGGGFQAVDDPPNWSLAGVMIEPGRTALAMAGRNLQSDSLPPLLAVGRSLKFICEAITRNEQHQLRVHRLRSTLRIASQFAEARETAPLLEMIAEEATKLLECDRASIFIWDRDHHEVIACPALGVAEGTLRLPDNKGIVGEVIHQGESIVVDDAYQDSRFDQSVDKASGYTTRNLLCVPLVDGARKRIGAFEVINKSEGAFTDDDQESLVELGIQAAIALSNTQQIEQLTRSREQLTAQVTEGVRIIGQSPAIVALRDTIGRLAGTDLPVLILGESGTGKEVVSQALHYSGPRRENPFIAVNCAALTETLLESELFGHERGAFTDAHESRAGKFELAEGGTLFLDEIGDMSLGGQAKLLRVLEQKVVTRVGGSQAIPINVRIVAATNAELSAAVREKKFREDLYFRLGVVTIDIPPLRDRPDDILTLAKHFLAHFSQQANRPRLTLSAEAEKRLQGHGWPGNVRELRNLMERVAFLSAGQTVEPKDLAFMLSPSRESILDTTSNLSLTDATKRFQQEFIRRSIRRSSGNMSEAAKRIGLHRSNLYRKMRQLDMPISDEESDESA